MRISETSILAASIIKANERISEEDHFAYVRSEIRKRRMKRVIEAIGDAGRGLQRQELLELDGGLNDEKKLSIVMKSLVMAGMIIKTNGDKKPHSGRPTVVLSLTLKGHEIYKVLKVTKSIRF